MRNEGAGWLGQTLAGLRPRSGASWPAQSGRWRRAAVAVDMRRAGSAGGRPLNGFVQFIQSRNAEPNDEF